MGAKYYPTPFRDSARLNALGSGDALEAVRAVSARAQELQTAKEMLAEIFGARPARWRR